MVRIWLIGVLAVWGQLLIAQTHLDTAVNFMVIDIDGSPHELYQYLDQGKHVVLDFFYTTCAPCIGILPELNWAMETYGCNQSDLVMLSIDYNDSDAAVWQFVQDYSTNIPAISGIEGGGNEIVSAYGIYAFPTVVLIAPNREILNQDIFPVSQSNLQTAIEGQAGILPVDEPCDPTITSLVNIDPSVETTFYVAPNPAQDRTWIHFEAESGAEEIDWVLYSLAGKSLRKGVISGRSPTSISLEGLPPGSYFLHLRSSKEVLGVCQVIVK